MSFEYLSYIKKPIWYGLGWQIDNGDISQVDDYVNPVQNQMGFEVHKVPVFRQYYENGDMKYFQVPERFITVRTDLPADDVNAYLGYVGDNYTVIQNDEMRDFALQLSESGQVCFEHVGTMRNGKVAWMLARVPAEYGIMGDVLYPYMLLTNSHDGSLAFMSIFTMIRARCWNTVSAIVGKDRYRYSIKHTQNSDMKVSECKEALKHGQVYAQRLRGELTKMAKDLMDKNFVDGFLAAVVRGEKFKKNKAGQSVLTKAEKTRQELAGLIWGGQIGGDSDAMFRDGKPTAYGLYSAWTQFDETERIVRCHEQEDGTKRSEEEARFDSIMFGGMSRKRDMVFDLLMRREELKNNAEKMKELVVASGVDED